MAGNFEPSLRRATVSSKHLIDCAIGISGRKQIVGAFNLAFGPDTTWHFWGFRKEATKVGGLVGWNKVPCCWKHGNLIPKQITA